jgi:hypothetical protein
VRVRMIDFFKLFPNVGALVVSGNPTMPASRKGCSRAAPGHSIDERVLLTAGHCIAWAAGGLTPFKKFSVTFQPERARPLDIAHPSLPPCPPPDVCKFRGRIREPDTGKRRADPNCARDLWRWHHGCRLGSNADNKCSVKRREARE